MTEITRKHLISQEELYKLPHVKYIPRTGKAFTLPELLPGEIRGDAELEIQLVPKTAWGDSLANKKSEQWKRFSRGVRNRADWECEICGIPERNNSRTLDSHEVWDFNEETGIQKLIRVIALCKWCHSVTHAGRSANVGTIERAISHAYYSAGWSKEDFDKKFEQSMVVWERRSQMQWRQDVSIVEDFLQTSPTPVSMSSISSKAAIRGDLDNTAAMRLVSRRAAVGVLDKLTESDRDSLDATLNSQEITRNQENGDLEKRVSIRLPEGEEVAKLVRKYSPDKLMYSDPGLFYEWFFEKYPDDFIETEEPKMVRYDESSESAPEEVASLLEDPNIQSVIIEFTSATVSPNPEKINEIIESSSREGDGLVDSNGKAIPGIGYSGHQPQGPSKLTFTNGHGGKEVLVQKALKGELSIGEQEIFGEIAQAN